MLSPFPGFVPAGPGPLTGEEVTARARRIRDDAGRYQPGPVLEQAAADGLVDGAALPRLFRYEIERSGITISGLVGVCRAADLVPHEGTIASAPDDPAPLVEIRPILALVEGPLPRPPATGARVVVVEPDGTAHAIEPVDGGAIDIDPPVVADGHHRRRAALSTRGPDATVLTLVVGAGGAGFEAGTFHRVFPNARALPLGASDRFDVEPLPTPAPVPGALVWVDGATGRSFVLTPSPEALATVREPLRAAPAAVAQALLYPLLELQEHEAVHMGTVDEALGSVPSTGGALLLPAMAVAGVISAARSGTLLPPKASRFRPKPVRGMVLRPVDP